MNTNKFNLTSPQENICMLDEFTNKNINIIAGVFNIFLCFDREKCVQVINSLVENNDALRFKMYQQNNTFFQKIMKYERFDVKTLRFPDKLELNEYIEQKLLIPIDIEEDRLCHFEIFDYGNGSGAIFIKLHHLVSDAWSLSQLSTQFIELYSSKEYNETEKKLIPSYVEFIESEKNYFETSRYQKDREFWHEYLKGLNDIVSLKETTKKMNSDSKSYTKKLSLEDSNSISRFCKEEKISGYLLFAVALATYIYRIKDNKDFVIGTPVLNRSNAREKKMIGMFISAVPLRIRIEEGMKIIDLIRQVSRNSLSMFRHQKFPITETMTYVHKNSDLRGKLYNIMLSYQNARISNIDEGFSAEWIPPKFIQDDLDIHIMDMNADGKYTIRYDYLADLFEETEIEYLHSRLMTIVFNFINDKDVDIEKIDIMSLAEKEKIVSEFNNTAVEYNKDRTVIELFKFQADKNPDKIAVVFEEREITYSQLNNRANQLANYLASEKNIRRGDMVSIIMNRGIDLICSILAVQKCGCSYIPIDPEYPASRVQFIIENSESKVAIISNEKCTDLDSLNVTCINIAKENIGQYDNTEPILNYNGNDIAYMIYTSGSTGNPKGVMVSNTNLVNFIYGVNQEIQISEKDNVVSITTISFDIFGLEIWLTLTMGAKLVLANETEQIDGESLNKLCLKNRVNVIQTTPTKLRLLTNKSSDIQYIKGMSKILLGGESLPEEYILNLKQITKSKIFNMYGPTETTIWSTVKDITDTIEICAGKPIQNTQVYIVDKKKRLLPIGVNGELAISGDSVALGYFKNEKLTSEKFTNLLDVEHNQNKVYLTGDLTNINFNGEIKVLGRTDFQIKLNGQRIELGEIEQKILEYNGIQSVVVILKNNNLIAFYVTDKFFENTFDDKELRIYLYSQLPIYMVPRHLKRIKEMPLTPNGKIDRKTIMGFEVECLVDKIVMPRTSTEKHMYDIWKERMKDKEFGIDTLLFDIGGDSFDVKVIIVKLALCGIKVKKTDFYAFPTIRGLAEHYEESLNKPSEFSVAEYKKDYSDILKTNEKVIHGDTKSEKIGNILLTGVTGFLGAHIASQFLDNEKGNIYCLIREKNGVRIEDRLKNSLNYFFDNKYDDLIGKRIFATCGDITIPDLGISDKDFINKLDFVIHSAACVQHYGRKENFLNINVKGTENVAKLCLKNDKKLIHMSTLSVSGNAFESEIVRQKLQEDVIFDELCFYNGQNLDNVYVYTKFKAEEVVLDCMKSGLKANIIRLGNLTGRYSDLKFQSNVEENAFANRLKSIIELGLFPKSSEKMYIEFTPIDLTSEAILKIARHFNTEHNMFHLFNHNHVYIDYLFSVLKDMDIDLKIISDNEFSKIVFEYIKNDKKIEMLSGILDDLDDNNVLDYSTNVLIKSDLTISYLKSIGFEWKTINDRYIKDYINYLKGISFLEV